MNTQDIYWQRRADFAAFAGPVDQLTRDNPVVRQYVELFATGAICTKEEALCQMVLALSKNWDATRKRLYEEMMLSTQRVVIPEDIVNATAS